MRWLIVGFGLLLGLWGCVEKQSTAEKRPEITGKIVVNVTQMKRDPLFGTLTLEGKVKNFTNTTLQSVSLRFEFYDKNSNSSTLKPVMSLSLSAFVLMMSVPFVKTSLASLMKPAPSEFLLKMLWKHGEGCIFQRLYISKLSRKRKFW